MLPYGHRVKDISGYCCGHDKYCSHLSAPRYKSINRVMLNRVKKAAKAKERGAVRVKLKEWIYD